MKTSHRKPSAIAFKSALYAGVAAVAFMGPSYAAAQATGQGGEVAQGLEEIVVTAQRREESMQRAGIAVDVVSADAISAAGVSNAADLAVLVPSLQITNNGGSNTSFYLRGVGAFSSNSYSDPAIAFNYDGVYVGRPAGASGVFYDLERVEVLKGPQGTLYGRNATGGAINVLPVRPKLGEYSGDLGLAIGNYDLVNIQGAVNIPLSDKSAFRIAANVTDRGGYLSDDSSDDKGYAVRAQYLYEFNDSLSARIGADYYKADGKGGGAWYIARSVYNPVNQTYAIQNSGLSPDIGLLDTRSVRSLTRTFSGITGRTTTPLQRQPFLDNDTFGVNAEVNWTNGLGVLTIAPAYRRFNQDSIHDALGFLIRTDETDEQVSLEGRLTSNSDGPLTWLLGGFYYKEDINSHFSVQQQVLDSFQAWDQTTESLAAFGRLTFKVSDTFRLVGGGRYTKDKKSFDGVANVLLDLCTSPTHLCPTAPLLPFGATADAVIAQMGLVQVAPGVYLRPGDPAAAGAIVLRGVTPISQSREDGKFTYRIGAEWDVAPSSLLYTSYETGFRSGGFAFSLFNPTFGPEEIQAFTLGSKNRFLDNRLQVNVEAFYWKYDDQQVSHQGTDPNVGQAYFTENIGESTNKGVEVELLFQPQRGTNLSADIQYLSAKYDSFTYLTPAIAAGSATPPPLTGCSVRPPAAVVDGAKYVVNCSGQEALRSPEWTVNLGASQVFQIGGLGLTAEASTHYQSANNTGFELLALQRVPAYWTSSASLTLASETEHWSVTAFINNIEDKRAGNFTFFNDTVATFSQVTTAPRTYGMRLNVKF